MFGHVGHRHNINGFGVWHVYVLQNAWLCKSECMCLWWLVVQKQIGWQRQEMILPCDNMRETRRKEVWNICEPHNKHMSNMSQWYAKHVSYVCATCLKHVTVSQNRFPLPSPSGTQCIARKYCANLLYTEQIHMFKPSVSGFLVELSMKEEWRCCATEPLIQVYCISLDMRLYMSTLPFIYVIIYVFLWTRYVKACVCHMSGEMFSLMYQHVICIRMATLPL